MPENQMQENQVRIDPKDLFSTIGEMTIELRMLRVKNAELQQENGKLREHNKELIVANNTTQKEDKGV
jgi:FtsZ-binding cell division protein ZapB